MEPLLLLLLVLLPAIVLVRCAFTYGHRTSTMPIGELSSSMLTQWEFCSSGIGPPTLPFIGNIHQITKKYTHIKYV